MKKSLNKRSSGRAAHRDGEIVHAVVARPFIDVTIAALSTARGMVISGITPRHRARRKKNGIETAVDPRLTAITGRIRSMLDGEPACFDDLTLDLSRCTPFQKKVLDAARRIPRGATVSYAHLARMAGHPRAVRAAASVMRSNPFPLIVPCHRVVKSDGTIGGFMGKRQGWEVAFKRRLLDLER